MRTRRQRGPTKSYTDWWTEGGKLTRKGRNRLNASRDRRSRIMTTGGERPRVKRRRRPRAGALHR